jgi:hypothetical protein
MTEQNQTDAMANILSKLNDVSNGTHKPSATSTIGDTAAMAAILHKLQAATGVAAQDIVTETQRNPNLAVAVNATRTDSGVSVSQYKISTQKKIVQEGLSKTFYMITDTKTGDIMHDSLGLFETAMGIVKHMLYTGDNRKVNRLLELDQEYIGAVMETYSHKSRLKRLNENSTQFDVTTAKYSNSRTKLQAVKIKLLKAL